MAKDQPQVQIGWWGKNKGRFDKVMNKSLTGFLKNSQSGKKMPDQVVKKVLKKKEEK